jgi:branched-chain amino acid transport system substrate-binding protein
VLKDRYDKMVTAVSYETTDATVESQLVSLQSAGKDVLITVATPKFAAQAIRKVASMNWKPMHILTGVSVSVGAVMVPAGPENGVGIISSAYVKDPTDPQWDNDAGMKEWRTFMAKYYPDGDLKDGGNVSGFGLTHTMLQVLKQCGNDFSRPNIMKQATNLHNLDNPVTLPGIKINSSPTDHRQDLELVRGHHLRRYGLTVYTCSVLGRGMYSRRRPRAITGETGRVRDGFIMAGASRPT